MTFARSAIATVALCCIICLAGCSGRGRKLGRGEDVEPIGGMEYGDISETELGERPSSMQLVDSAKFENVLFAYDMAQIDQQERAKIEKVAQYLRRNAGVGVIVEGHCDERGSREYNMALGERRALAVRAYLIGLGIDPDIIQTVSYGEEKPLLFGHDEESWRVNRRAEFVLFHQ